MPSGRKIRQIESKSTYGGFVVTVEFADGDCEVIEYKSSANGTIIARVNRKGLWRAVDQSEVPREIINDVSNYNGVYPPPA
jgi:hypothetical protein